MGVAYFVPQQPPSSTAPPGPMDEMPQPPDVDDLAKPSIRVGASLGVDDGKDPLLLSPDQGSALQQYEISPIDDEDRDTANVSMVCDPSVCPSVLNPSTLNCTMCASIGQVGGSTKHVPLSSRCGRSEEVGGGR